MMFTTWAYVKGPIGALRSRAISVSNSAAGSPSENAQSGPAALHVSRK